MNPSTPTREYIYAGSQLVAKLEGSSTNYFHPDHLSVRAITDGNGNIVEQKGNFPYGESWYSGANSNKLRFTTYERDSESGNDYAMARYYVNRLGRFNSPDPLAGSVADPQSLNHYAYARNDPTDAFDPSGLIPEGGGDNSVCFLDDTETPCTEVMGILGSGAGAREPLGFSSIQYAIDNSGNPHPYLQEVTGDPDTPVQASFFGGLSAADLERLGIDMHEADATEEPLSGLLGADVRAALFDLRSRLKNDPECLAFLNSKGADALQLLGQIIDNHLYGQDFIPPKPNGDGTFTVTNGQSGPTMSVPNAVIVVNTVGAFFAPSYLGMPLTTNNGRISGGSPAARTFIVLHELAHGTNALRPDANLPAAVKKNDNDLNTHCSKTIKGH